mmetsp:Transcript_144673/g.463554  ORF Transcript_144673/g.463554 Transcript_144673/m.463554 type:complete len:493 (-) Transcript_144673:93-1571(-)
MRRSAPAVALGTGAALAAYARGDFLAAFAAPSGADLGSLAGASLRGSSSTASTAAAAASSAPSAAGLPCAVGCTVATAALVAAARARRGSARRASLPVRSVAVAERAGTTNGDVLSPVNPGLNPATCWPAGKPCFTTEYPMEYDLKDPKGSFEKVGKFLLKEMEDELPGMYELPKKEVEWVRRSLEYNTLGGKMNRGLIVVETGVELLKSQGKTPTSTDLCRFAILGWCVELLQACMLMADDMMDGSLTRRGAPCWYRLENVGLLATNDFLMVEMFVYKALKRHFGQEPYFVWLVDLFLETTFQTECGQLLDSICSNCELEELTTERWTLLVKYKTAFYSFYLPVALSMLVVGVRDRASYDTAREALMLMGVYFQAQDDFLDAFANPEELGKIGTDIQDKKCSWLFAHAFHEHGTPEAKEYLIKHYGKCKVGSEEEQHIKDLYKELGLQELFQKYEADTQTKLLEYREQIEAAGLPWSVFERFFAMIFKRRK